MSKKTVVKKTIGQVIEELNVSLDNLEGSIQEGESAIFELLIERLRIRFKELQQLDRVYNKKQYKEFISRFQ